MQQILKPEQPQELGGQGERIVFLVLAYRYGHRSAYHFPVGVFDNKKIAEKAAKDHRHYRGCKYEHVIWPIDLNKEYGAEDTQPVFNSCKT